VPTALITGITGQDGSYLAELLLGKGYRVVGFVRKDAAHEPNNVEHLADRVELITGDLRDAHSVADAVRESAPDEVYNLAAQSDTQASFDQAELTEQVVGQGVAHLLESLRHHASAARFFQASSSEIFGQPLAAPQNEQTGMRPRSPYGHAKVFAQKAVTTARHGDGLFAVSGILYNHESPRRGPQFVSRKITMGVARIQCGLQADLVLGDLDARRDWGFAGDYVDAMWRMLQTSAPKDYVIGTGRTWSVRELCEMAFRVVGRDYQEHVKVDPGLVRPPELVPLVADASLARRELGWQATTAFPQVVEMMVEADLARVEAAAR